MCGLRCFPALTHPFFTVDNGNEVFDYKDVEQRLGTKQFFADPGCPGQRGLNENTNSETAENSV